MRRREARRGKGRKTERRNRKQGERKVTDEKE